MEPVPSWHLFLGKVALLAQDERVAAAALIPPGGTCFPYRLMAVNLRSPSLLQACVMAARSAEQDLSPSVVVNPGVVKTVMVLGYCHTRKPDSY